MSEQGNKQLIDLLSSVSLTTDIWTSMANEAYITISAHWISPSWEVISCVLETKEFPDSHTGVAIAEKILETMEAYNIKDKVSTIVHTIVHDQAANMQLSLRILHESDDIESLCCNAHKLQLCLKAGFAIVAIDRLIRCSGKLVGHFKHSALACGELKTRQVQMNVTEKKLVQSCVTRWNSVFYMLQRLVEMRWPISAVLSDGNVTKRSDRYLDLSNEQWVLAEELVKLLKPFEVATTFLCGEAQSIVSSTLPVIHGLTEYLEPDDADSQPLLLLLSRW